MKAPLGGTVIAYIIVCLGPISRRKRLNVHPAQPVLSYPKWVDGPRISPGKGHPRLVRMYGCGPSGLVSRSIFVRRSQDRQNILAGVQLTASGTGSGRHQRKKKGWYILVKKNCPRPVQANAQLSVTR